MGRAASRLSRLPAAAVLLLTGCSPVYVLKAASGHADLLFRRRTISRVLKDPSIAEDKKAKLLVVSEARNFAFTVMGLARSRDYSTYAEIRRPHVTWIVTGAPRTRLVPHEWWFPFLGRVPYKGYFNEGEAAREKVRLEKRGLDAAVSGVAAYNTPLWFSDPVPSPVLSYSRGELAELVIHELAHGTVFYKNHVAFDESLATFIGERGAEEFLTRGYGPDSEEMREYGRARERARRIEIAFDGIRRDLETLFGSDLSEAEKLTRRGRVFEAGRGRLEAARGEPWKGDLNNAVVLAHRLYHEDLEDFSKVFDMAGGDWRRAITFLRSLNPKGPREDLKRRVAPPLGL